MLETPDGSLLFTSHARATGELARIIHGLQTGELARVRRGSFVDAQMWKSLSREQQHFLMIIATASAAKRSPIFSHESAAVASGLPIVEGLPDRVQITVPPGSGLRSNKVVARHEAGLAAAEVIEFASMRFTRLDRTLVDFAAGRSFLSATCAADHLLRQGSVTRDHLLEAIARRRPFRGSRKVEAVVRFASPLSASPNESLARVRFEQLGFPRPEQQREYRGSRGEHYTVDFYWPEFDVICESDGRVKYESPAFLSGRTPQQALWDEKLREDDLRAQCRGFLRLSWDDAWNRAGLVAKLTRAGIPRRR